MKSHLLALMAITAILPPANGDGQRDVIADEVSAPRETVHPGMVLAQPAANAVSAPGSADGTSWNPQKSPTGPVTILISSASKGLYVYRNGVEIGRARFTASLPRGQYIYSALDGADAQGRRKWLRVDGKSAWRDPSFTSIAQSLAIPETFIAGVRSVVTPGTTMVISDLPVDKSTQSDPDFKVIGVWETAQR